MNIDDFINIIIGIMLVLYGINAIRYYTGKKKLSDKKEERRKFLLEKKSPTTNYYICDDCLWHLCDFSDTLNS